MGLELRSTSASGRVKLRGTKGPACVGVTGLGVGGLDRAVCLSVREFLNYALVCSSSPSYAGPRVYSCEPSHAHVLLGGPLPLAPVPVQTDDKPTAPSVSVPFLGVSKSPNLPFLPLHSDPSVLVLALRQLSYLIPTESQFGVSINSVT